MQLTSIVGTIVKSLKWDCATIQYLHHFSPIFPTSRLNPRWSLKNRMKKRMNIRCYKAKSIPYRKSVEVMPKWLPKKELSRFKANDCLNISLRMTEIHQIRLHLGGVKSTVGQTKWCILFEFECGWICGRQSIRKWFGFVVKRLNHSFIMHSHSTTFVIEQSKVIHLNIGHPFRAHWTAAIFD